jgi:hypothetical protein
MYLNKNANRAESNQTILAGDPLHLCGDYKQMTNIDEGDDVDIHLSACKDICKKLPSTRRREDDVTPNIVSHIAHFEQQQQQRG